MKKTISRWLITTTATAAIVAGVVGTGAVLAQEPEATPAPEQSTPDSSASENEPSFRGKWRLRIGWGIWQSELAEALGITVEELQAAQAVARTNALERAVDEGLVTQELADRLAARATLREYVDHTAILADALGMTVEELEAARDEGQRLPEIMEAQGLDREIVEAAIRAGYEEAVQEAVADGAITQEQADQLLSGQRFGERGRFGPRGGHWHHGPGMRGPRWNPDASPAVTPESEG